MQRGFKVVGGLGLLLGLILVLGSQVESSSAERLGSLSKLLKEAGLGSQQGAISEEQRQLVEKISEIYADEDELRSREIAIQDEVGLARPDGKQKGELQVIANKHLANNQILAALVKELKAASSEGAAVEPAQAA